MELDKLVHLITREVLSQLQESKPRENEEKTLVIGERGCPKTEAVLDALGPDGIPILPDELREGHRVTRRVIPHLAIDEMVALASGTAGTPRMEQVLTELLHGRRVEVFEYGYKAFRETAPFALYQLYERYEKTLESFGVHPFEARRPDTVRLNGRLITEKEMAKACEAGASTIEIPHHSLITELAREIAREKGIHLKRS